MAINRVNPSGITPPDPSRVPPAQAGRSGGQVDGVEAVGRVEQKPQAADQLDLSAAARELASQEEIPKGTLSPERLREVSRRLAEDFYEEPSVREDVARRLHADLGLPREE